MPAGTFELIAGHVGGALHRLGGRVDDGDATSLLADLGLRPPRALREHGGLVDAARRAVSAATDLGPPLDALAAAIDEGTAADVVAHGHAVGVAIGAVVRAVDALAAAVGNAAAGLDGLTDEERAALEAFAALLPRRLVHALVVDHLAAQAPGLLALGRVLGLVDRESEGGVDDLHPPWIRRELHLSRLPQLLTDPAGYARDVYGWGDQAFDGVALLTRVRDYFTHLGVESLLLSPPDEGAVLEAYVVGLAVDDAADPPGLVVSLRFAADDVAADDDEVAVSYPVRGPWVAQATAEGRFEADARALVDPPLSFRLVPPSGEAFVRAGLRAVAEPEQPLLVLGAADGPRLEAGRLAVGLAVAADWDPDERAAVGRPEVEAALADGRLIFALGGSDGFLRALLPTEVVVDIDLAATWDEDGLRLHGGAGLAVSRPLSQRAGAVKLERLELEVGVDERRLGLRARASGVASIGPCTVHVDGVGVAGGLDLSGDALGVGDVTFEPVPPRGLALSIDAGPVAGGGFMSFDPDAGRYAGAVQLDVRGLSLAAVGVVTETPDGYALLVQVSSADFTPVALGFGFTLNGVGGLLGVHRAADVDALRGRLRGGGLDGLLFPDDPVADAAELMERMRAVFPATPGRHLVGPAALIGWGTPTVLTVELLIALELPEPVRLVALAQLRARLPSEGRALVRLNMDAVGVVDLGRGRASLDATLYDSRVTAFAIEGEVALRARWLGSPELVLAAGGLHPRYPPPVNFPDLDRLSLRMERGRAKVRLDAYLALTSNTVQAGARLEVEVGVGRFSIDGVLGFDVLFERSPFRFVADVAGGVRVRWGSRTLLGVHLEMTLSGPSPMHVRGSATIEVWRFSHSIDFDVELDRGDPPLPELPVDPLPDLLASLEDPANWSATLPLDDRSVVSLRDVDRADRVLVHPLGELTVRQRALPLDIEITRYAGAPLAGGPRAFSLSPSLPGAAQAETRSVTDYFAPAQFLDLDDHDTLSAPAFERLPSGLRLETPRARFGGEDDATLMTSAPVGHRTRVVDADGAVRAAADASPSPAAASTVVRRAGPRSRHTRYPGPDRRVTARDPVYVLARVDDLRVGSFTDSGGSDGFAHTVASQRLRKRERGKPTGLQVVARHEAVGAIPGLLPPGASPEEPGIYEERGSFGGPVPGARRVRMTPQSDPLPPTQARGRRWLWIAPLEEEP